VSTRRLGNSDLNIKPVGFGAWAIGGTGYDFAWGKQDDADSIAVVHRSLELGVNWIDTAPVYGTGHSEEIVASALKEWRGSRPYVSTKCVMRWDEKGRVTTVFNRDSIPGLALAEDHLAEAISYNMLRRRRRRRTIRISKKGSLTSMRPLITASKTMPMSLQRTLRKL
jgi:aryl-alcohol dehydrogenase-like predicted oxidoreductase